MSNDAWTQNHHLVGTTLPEPVLKRGDDVQYFSWRDVDISVAAFHAEDARNRQPALWRSYVEDLITGSINDGSSKFSQSVEALDCSDPDDTKRPAQPTAPRVLLAVDHISSDWQERLSTTDAAQYVQDEVAQRMQHVLLRKILRDLMPPLIMTAALEETQSQFLRQRRRQSDASGGVGANAAAPPSLLASPPPYYTHAPQAYLVASSPQDGSSGNGSQQRFTFTPSQLLSRIKLGCKMAYDWHCDRLPPSETSLRSVASRRVSSRVAKLQAEQQAHPPVISSDLYKVQPGGKVAMYLSERLGQDWRFVENGTTRESAAVDHRSGSEKLEDTESLNGDEEEMTMILVESNPYLQSTSDALLEWLGKKTAKLLSLTEIQELSASLVYTRDGKKRRAEDLGLSLGTMASSLDRKILESLHPFSGSESSVLALVAVSDHEGVAIEDMDTNYFGKSLFYLSIIDDSVENELAAIQQENMIVAEQKFQQRKEWDGRRHHDVHSGYTQWPSWTDAVEIWVSSRKAKPKEDSDQIVSETEMPNVTDDQALALSLATEQSSSIAGRRRPTRKAADTGGTFYGSQANLTQKQLMDTVLRIVSQKGFQLMMDLVSVVPDESRDPLRRMRTSLGRLVWKRNQLARVSVDTSLTDAAPWIAIQSDPLLSAAPSTETKVNATTDKGDETFHALVRYIRELQETEIQLRRLVLQSLAEIPVNIVATAADERKGTIESMDDADFEASSLVEWISDGHEFLGREIFRPETTHITEERPSCLWFQIQAFSMAVAAPTDDFQVPSERPQIGLARECVAVERRMRFKAIPLQNNRELAASSILLTEAQVRAGLKAAELERRQSKASQVCSNPYANRLGAKVTLFKKAVSAIPSEIHGVVVGHDSEADGEQVKHKILVLADGHDESRWARFENITGTSLTCTLDGFDGMYNIQQFDFHSSSLAFQECRSIVNFLQHHPKALPFLEPVDPILLRIPTYFDVIHKPMDVSTVARKLENGEYSNIPPSQNAGRSPTARMLNGPFRRDVELIFDNAIQFNPVDDWIHQAAASLKKSTLRKVEQLSKEADGKIGRVTYNRSVYVDDDSDIDMYVYESDPDEDYEAGSRPRKRKQTNRIPHKEDASSFAVERGVRLQKVLGDGSDFRGTLSCIPVNNDASSFSLPPSWSARHCNASNVRGDDTSGQERDDEIATLMALQQQVEEMENGNLRRSTRAAVFEGSERSLLEKSDVHEVEYIEIGRCLAPNDKMLRSRFEVERHRECMHEEYYAKIYYDKQSTMSSFYELQSGVGRFVADSFPPYLGRVVPRASPSSFLDSCWEIRSPFMIQAVRWVIRGLIQSKHLAEIEPLTPNSIYSGVVIANHAYYIDATSKPFDVLDQRELQRRKQRAEQNAGEESDSDIEMSEYEKLRADRVARNAERLKSLGLG